MYGKHPTWTPMAVAAITAALALAGCKDEGGSTDGLPTFLSADESATTTTADRDGNYAAPAAAGDMGMAEDAMDTSADSVAGAPVEVEEGDIYRVVSTALVANVNRYRGVQLIDVSDVAAPQIVGTVALQGEPVEMYAVDGRILVLFNGWDGLIPSDATNAMWGARPARGAMVALIDISVPSAPVVLHRVAMQGTIAVSRLVSAGDAAALYVALRAANGQAALRGLSLDGDRLVPAGAVDVAGSLIDISASPDALLVAVNDGDTTTVRSYGIADASGAIADGAQVTVPGMVRRKTDMRQDGTLLKVFSTQGGINHLTTWDVSDPSAPAQLDSVAFGEGEDLYATLFLDDKAFAVTFRQTDPFHGFEILADGSIVEHPEYIVSGWNDFFKPAFGGTRLLGVGQDAGAVAISLYDTTLTNPDPLIQRVTLEPGSTALEAQWDDRAFTVLEDAVSATAADGTEETGLILVPAMSWYDWEGAWWQSRATSHVQLLTFSETTITKRGVLDIEGEARRGFLTDATTAASLSEDQFNLFDIADVDTPDLLGSVDLAPSYSDLVSIGDYWVRVRTTADASLDKVYCETAQEARDKGRIEILSKEADPNTTQVVSSAAVSQVARVLIDGDKAVALSPAGDCSDPDQWTVEVVDLSDPTAISKIATTTVSLPTYAGWEEQVRPALLDYAACYGPGCNRPVTQRNAYLKDGVLLIPSEVPQERSLGRTETCYIYAENTYYGWEEDIAYPGDVPEPTVAVTPDPDMEGVAMAATPARATEPEQVYYQGARQCVTPQDGETTCTGTLEACTIAATGELDCTPVAQDEVPNLRKECIISEQKETWTSYRVDIVDLSAPATPVLRDPILLDADHRAAGLLVTDDTLYLNTTVPVDVPDDDRAWVAYYVTAVPRGVANATVGDPINIPGAAFAVWNDRLVTRDPVWNDQRIDTTVRVIGIDGDRVTVYGSRVFAQQVVEAITVDDAGHAFVVTRDDTSDGYGVAVSDVAWDGEAVPGASGGAAPPESGVVVATGTDANTDAPVVDTDVPTVDTDVPDTATDVTGSDADTAAPTGTDATGIPQPAAIVAFGGDMPTYYGGSATISVLDLAEESLPVVYTAAFTGYELSIVSVRASVGLARLNGGLLVLDTSDVTAITPVAYHPLGTWTATFDEETQTSYVLAGPYGIFRIAPSHTAPLPSLIK